MPKAPSSKAQAKPALTQRKLPSKATKKGSGDASPPASTPSSPSSSGDPTSFSLDLDKELVVKIILAKLEANTTCDWYQMSQRLKAEGEVGLDQEDLGNGVTGKQKGKGRGRGKGKQKGKRELSGTDLHDLYHNKILPALKNGRALWVEDGEGCDRRASTSSTSDSSTAGASKAISGLGLRVNTKNKTKPKTKQRLSRGDEEDELDSSDDD